MTEHLKDEDKTARELRDEKEDRRKERAKRSKKTASGRAAKSTAAYRVVDIETIPEEARDDIRADAEGGGGLYGLRVVEVAVNGPAQFPIFGVYEHDEDLWEEAQSEFGFDDTPTDPAAPIDQAKARADAEADKVKKAEQAELDQIKGGVTPGGPKGQAESDRTDKPTK